jgi:hypothetical protein
MTREVCAEAISRTGTSRSNLCHLSNGLGRLVTRSTCLTILLGSTSALPGHSDYREFRLTFNI